MDLSYRTNEREIKRTVSGIVNDSIVDEVKLYKKAVSKKFSCNFYWVNSLGRHLKKILYITMKSTSTKISSTI